MKFSNAALLLSENRRIRRRIWGKYEWIGTMGFNVHSFITLEDWTASDWELFESSEALNLLIDTFEEALLKPEFLKALERISKS